jgi:hypothetical protein
VGSDAALYERAGYVDALREANRGATAPGDQMGPRLATA